MGANSRRCIHSSLLFFTSTSAENSTVLIPHPASHLYIYMFLCIYISTRISTFLHWYLHGYLCAAADKCGFGGWAEWSECENNKKQRKREVGWDTRGVAYFSYINKSFQHISFFFSLVTCFPCRMAFSRYFSSQLQIASCWHFCKTIYRCLNPREYQTKNLCLS